MLLSACAFAQQESNVVASACGPIKTTFDVKVDESQHNVAEPESGKALVYFIQDIGAVNCLGGCLKTRIGVDGAWVGAIQHNSYFSVSVEPGEHHVCARPQSRFLSATSEKYAGVSLALAHFNAEAGKVYYFRTRTFTAPNQAIFDLDPLDGDQGKYLISAYPLSVSHAKQ
jgi:hypothetical protein